MVEEIENLPFRKKFFESDHKIDNDHGREVSSARVLDLKFRRECFPDGPVVVLSNIRKIHSYK
jgi:hypothetical protein